jgi:flagellar hook protein FlgE
MSSAFSIALSALKADSDAINITGNNLANLNTTGFKGSSVQFEDLMSEYLGGQASGGIGMGVAAPIGEQVFSQGSVQSSAVPLATAIQGSGFFVLQSAGGQQEFSRDGSFSLNANGVLQTQTGENVQGWMATNGVVNSTGAPTNLVFAAGTILPPTPTKNIGANINLDATTATGQSWSTPIQVVDSLGTTHMLTLNFTQSAANKWSYDVTIPGSDLSGNPSGAVSVLSAPGTLTFNTDGTLAPATTATPPGPNTSPVTLSVTGLADGAANMPINWNLFNSSGGGTITQYDQTSGLASPTQDGSQAAQLSDITIANGGQVVASYSNGQQVVAGQLAMASIDNPGSLLNVGNNNFTVSGQTAIPAIGLPQSGGRGQIVGGSLEGSNVDMGAEFTNLIVYQSSYGANSKVITTANTMSQDLLNLIQ